MLYIDITNITKVNIMCDIENVANSLISTGEIPYQENALVWIDGVTIEESGVKYFVDKKSGKNFKITDYDFPEAWTEGFPYKSKATISAPVGDAALIAADINNFLYDSGGVPNQIPVVSLFNNIDYENKIFCRNVEPVTETKTVETTVDGVFESYDIEVSEGFVKDIVVYIDSFIYANMGLVNKYFNVPEEDLTAKWSDFTNGDNSTGDGTKANPYKTIYKSMQETTVNGNVYAKSGEYQEDSITRGYLRLDKQVNITGTGLTKVNATTASTEGIIYGVNADTGTIKRLILEPTIEAYASYNSKGWDYEKCLMRSGTTSVLHSVCSDIGISNEYKDCILISTNVLDDIGYNSIHNGNYIETSGISQQSKVAWDIFVSKKQ
jgi:hypothetical protein